MSALGRVARPDARLMSLDLVPSLPPSIRAWADHLVVELSARDAGSDCTVFVVMPLGLVLAAHRWIPDEERRELLVGRWVVPFEHSVLGGVAASGLPSLIPDVRLDPAFRSWPGSRSHSELAVPVMDTHRTVVAVANLEHPRLGAYDISDLDAVVAIAERAGTAFPGLADRPRAVSGGR
jgi:hypothetical protein